MNQIALFSTKLILSFRSAIKFKNWPEIYRTALSKMRPWNIRGIEKFIQRKNQRTATCESRIDKNWNLHIVWRNFSISINFYKKRDRLGLYLFKRFLLWLYKKYILPLFKPIKGILYSTRTGHKDMAFLFLRRYLQWKYISSGIDWTTKNEKYSQNLRVYKNSLN